MNVARDAVRQGDSPERSYWVLENDYGPYIVRFSLGPGQQPGEGNVIFEGVLPQDPAALEKLFSWLLFYAKTMGWALFTVVATLALAAGPVAGTPPVEAPTPVAPAKPRKRKRKASKPTPAAFLRQHLTRPRRRP